MWIFSGLWGRGVAPEPLNKCAEGAFQVANGRRSRHETQRSCGDPPKRSVGVMCMLQLTNNFVIHNSNVVTYEQQAFRRYALMHVIVLP